MHLFCCDVFLSPHCQYFSRRSRKPLAGVGAQALLFSGRNSRVSCPLTCRLVQPFASRAEMWCCCWLAWWLWVQICLRPVSCWVWGINQLWSFLLGASGCAGMSFFCNIGPIVFFFFLTYCFGVFFACFFVDTQKQPQHLCCGWVQRDWSHASSKTRSERQTNTLTFLQICFFPLNN